MIIQLATYITIATYDLIKYFCKFCVDTNNVF